METQKLEKEVYSVSDMQEMLGGASYSTATRKMREIRSVSDILHIKGIIHKLDWEAYINRFEKKDSTNSSNPGTV